MAERSRSLLNLFGITIAVAACTNVSSTKAQNGKKHFVLFTVLRHLRRASCGANGCRTELKAKKQVAAQLAF